MSDNESSTSIPVCHLKISSSVLASDSSDSSSEDIPSVTCFDRPPRIVNCFTPPIMSPTTRLSTKKEAASRFIRTRSRSKKTECSDDAQEVLAGHTVVEKVPAKPNVPSRRKRDISLSQEIREELNDDLFDGVDLDGLDSLGVDLGLLEKPAGQQPRYGGGTEKPVCVLQEGKVLFYNNDNGSHDGRNENLPFAQGSDASSAKDESAMATSKDMDLGFQGSNASKPPAVVTVVGRTSEPPAERGSDDSDVVSFSDLPTPEREKKAADLGANLARGLRQGTVRKNISEEVQEFWNTSNENSTKYTKDKDKSFKRMLSILAEYGGEEMKRLATVEVDDGVAVVPLLVDVLRNSNRRFQLIILDECLKFFVEFAKKEGGDIYSCGSMHQMLKHIFSTLNLSYNISVKDKDFPAQGSFRGRIANIWKEERAKNPEFGQAKGMSEICLNDMDLVYDGIAEGKLQPNENPYHLRLLITFSLLRFFGLRPQEAAFLDKTHVRWGTYRMGPDKGKKYVELYVDIKKVRQLKLGQWKIPKNYGKIKVRDNPEDTVLNVYFWIQYYVSKLPDDTGR